MKISLRGRLALWFFLTVPAIIFVLMFTARHVIVSNMRGDLDSDLQARTQQFAKFIASNAKDSNETYTDMITRFTEQESASIPLLLRLSDTNGTILATFGQVPVSMVPRLDHQLHRADIGGGQFHTIKAKNTSSLRVYTAPVNNPANGEKLFLIQTGDSLATINAAEYQLLRYTIIEGIVGSLVIFFIGLLIVRQGLHPLDKILSDVRKMEASNLGVGIAKEPRPPELQQLADNLNNMWQRLETAFKTRETFVASVSHDLRTPLTVLQGQIEVLLMQPSLDSQVKDSLQRMSREVRRLVRMTNNLLLNAQLESNPAHAIGAVSLKELMNEIFGDIRTLAKDIDLSLSAPEDVIVSGDYDLLKQMILNIVDNAVKFTPQHGSVDMSLGKEGEWAVIQVSDSGRGIPNEDLPHVTEPFYRKAGSSKKSARDGVGLGLAIVKQVVDLHHGRLEIESQEGQGTRVKIYLPSLLTTDHGEDV